MDDDLQRGRLEQACPKCGRWEAAGSYCSGCHRRMTEADWYRNGDKERRQTTARMALENPTTPPKRGRGRPRKEMAA